MPDIVSDGKTRVVWCTAIATIASPTQAELNAGVQLQSFMTAAGLTGLQPTTNRVSTRSLADRFDTAVVGSVAFEDIELEFKRQTGTDTVYNTLTYGTNGYLVVRTGLDQGNAWAANQGGSAGGTVRVYPAQCGEVSHRDPEPDSVDRYGVPLTVTGSPNLRSVVV